MITIALYLLFAMPTSPCETIGPRLDGTYVTICHGTVTRVTDRVPAGAYTYLAPESR